MTDRAIRELERAPEEDAAVALLLRQRVRTGDLNAKRLSAAAQLGYLPAVIASGGDPVEVIALGVDPVDADMVVREALALLAPAVIVGWAYAAAARIATAQGKRIITDSTRKGMERVAAQNKRIANSAREGLEVVAGVLRREVNPFEAERVSSTIREVVMVAGNFPQYSEYNFGWTVFYVAAAAGLLGDAEAEVGNAEAEALRDGIVELMTEHADTAAQFALDYLRPPGERNDEGFFQEASSLEAVAERLVQRNELVALVLESEV